MQVRDEQSATLTCRRRLLCSGLCQAARPPSPEWCWSASPWAKAAAAAVELTDGRTQGERCEMWPWCTNMFTCSPWALWIEPPRSDALSVSGPWRRSPSLSRTVCKNNRRSGSVRLIGRFSQGSCSWSKVKPLKLLHPRMFLKMLILCLFKYCEGYFSLLSLLHRKCCCCQANWPSVGFPILTINHINRKRLLATSFSLTQWYVDVQQ